MHTTQAPEALSSLDRPTRVVDGEPHAVELADDDAPLAPARLIQGERRHFLRCLIVAEVDRGATGGRRPHACHQPAPTLRSAAADGQAVGIGVMLLCQQMFGRYIAVRWNPFEELRCRRWISLGDEVEPFDDLVRLC